MKPQSRSTEEFIALASLTHKNKYDYSKTKYTFSSLKVVIICPLHGEFKQVANSHLLGHGCFRCGKERAVRDSLQKRSEHYITKAKVKFPELDFSNTVFTTGSEKITVACKVHGNFVVGANALLHKNSKGCPSCLQERNSVERALKFKEDVALVHGNKYDYSMIDKVEMLSKAVPIVCSDHGVFYQTPKNHLKGSICTYCMNLERGYRRRYKRLNREATLYFVYFKEYDLFKLGVTVDIVKRFNGESNKPEILFSKMYEHEAQAYLIETQLLRQFSCHMYKGTPVLSRKGNTELLVADILEELIPSVEIIENTEEFKALAGSE